VNNTKPKISPSSASRPKGLFQVMREKMRLAHMSLFTEKAYTSWVRRFIAVHSGKHPRTLNSAHVTEFLSHLAADKNVAPGTQNQALNALVYLYKQVLQVGFLTLGSSGLE